MWLNAEDFLKKDKYLSPLIQKWGHCDIKPRIHTDYFQALVREIIGQQLSGRVANVIYERLKAKIFGKLTVIKVSSLSDNELRSCGMAWSKVRAIKDLVQKIVNCELKIENLHSMTDEEVKKELIMVNGIGPWTAEMFLMFTLGRPDIFPTNDLGINKAIFKILKKEMTKIEMLNFSER
ncbi:MAG TPA: DNA-3-methyladenine glycosylase 2 family protein, partial [Alphaproteobacteria bacterium]|nr:DNA-3-methyladenine glycosylase 2 family protein [Alphaproteobacteria bacterium]